MKTRSGKVFAVSEYGDIYRASQAASDYAKQFSDPWRHRFNEPLLWVRYDHAAQGYVIEPNLNPVNNRAWKDLLNHEAKCYHPATHAEQGALVCNACGETLAP